MIVAGGLAQATLPVPSDRVSMCLGAARAHLTVNAIENTNVFTCHRRLFKIPFAIRYPAAVVIACAF
jgi:hypothetical protein